MKLYIINIRQCTKKPTKHKKIKNSDFVIKVNNYIVYME